MSMSMYHRHASPPRHPHHPIRSPSPVSLTHAPPLARPWRPHSSTRPSTPTAPPAATKWATFVMRSHLSTRHRRPASLRAHRASGATTAHPWLAAATPSCTARAHVCSALAGKTARQSCGPPYCSHPLRAP
eukprot:3023301-Prymnesium_polylepis.2